MSGTLGNIGLDPRLHPGRQHVRRSRDRARVAAREPGHGRLPPEAGAGQAVPRSAEDPNRFLAAVQVGVTLAGFLSASFGGVTLSGDLAPHLVDLGLPEGAADVVALVLVTVAISYFSLVLGELAPKRLALQRAEGFALALGPTVDRVAKISRPVIWLLSVSTDVVVRLVGGDPRAQARADDRRGAARPGQHPRDARRGGAPHRRGRLRGRRPADPRGDDPAHRGRLPRCVDAGVQGRQGGAAPAALALPGDPRLRRRRHRLRARARPARPRHGRAARCASASWPGRRSCCPGRARSSPPSRTCAARACTSRSSPTSTAAPPAS